MSAIAIIPARGGSKGVPFKNIKLLGGHPLIAYSIMAATLSKRIDRVIVSTDSEEIAEISRAYGAEVPFLRPAEISGDSAIDIEFVQHAIRWMQDNEEVVPVTMVHLRPTTPLRDPDLIDAAIALFLQHPNASSLRSGHEAAESPYKWFGLDEGGFFTPFMGQAVTDLPRQAVPKAYIPNGYVDVVSVAFIQRTGHLLGDRILAFQTPPCVEVDTIEEFSYLTYYLESKGHLLKPALDLAVRR